jgi:hypothetical protein
MVWQYMAGQQQVQIVWQYMAGRQQVRMENPCYSSILSHGIVQTESNAHDIYQYAHDYNYSNYLPALLWSQSLQCLQWNQDR